MQGDLRTALASLLLAAPLAAVAGPDERLVQEYAHFAGSRANAESLVSGLRNDEPVKLATRSKTTTFTSPTGKMGYGNVDIALSLAKASLAEQGIRNPTPEQIKAALNGGTVTTKSGERVRLPGVLKLRASGMGWGQIAHKYGFKLGELMRREGGWERDHKRADSDGKREGRDSFHKVRLERPDYARPHKVERVERPMRPEKPERPQHRR